MHDRIVDRFRTVAPSVDFCSLRFMQTRSSYLSVRQNILQPVSTAEDMGAMITVIDKGGFGYAGTSDMTESGLRRAVEHARSWARRSAGHSVVDFSTVALPRPNGTYTSPVQLSWHDVSLSDKIDLLRSTSETLKNDERIADWEASLWHTESDTLFITADGGRVHQVFSYVVPMLIATANAGAETQTRTFAGRGYCRQGGMEVLDQCAFRDAAPRISAEAVQLLLAPNGDSNSLPVRSLPLADRFLPEKSPRLDHGGECRCG